MKNKCSIYWILVFPERFKMALVADESEVLPEGEDEILHVMDDGVLHRPLVHVLPVADTQFLHVDEV